MSSDADSAPAPVTEVDPGEVLRLRLEVQALRDSLGLQAMVEELPDSFDALAAAVGTEWLAVPLRHVLEVIPRVLVNVIPEAPGQVAGYVRWRGIHVPLVDMARSLGGPALPVRLEDRIVVVRRGSKEVSGLLVSEVEGVVRVEKAGLSALRPDASGARWALGLLQQAGRPLLLVSLEKLMGFLTTLALPQGQEGLA
jgi:chemotaxis signal transduction protein